MKQAMVALCIASSGCAAVMRPPANPVDPVPVFIVDYGRHSSLVLPRAEGGLREYAYGQWDWFALGRDEWYRAPMTMLIPQQGALGRRDVPSTANADELAQQVMAESVHSLPVERAAAAALVSRLDARFEAERSTMVFNDEYELSFVHDADDYWIVHHCNTATVAWLREIGCKVRGTPPLAKFEVKLPE